MSCVGSLWAAAQHGATEQSADTNYTTINSPSTFQGPASTEARRGAKILWLLVTLLWIVDTVKDEGNTRTHCRTFMPPLPFIVAMATNVKKPFYNFVFNCECRIFPAVSPINGQRNWQHASLIRFILLIIHSTMAHGIG